MLVTCAIVGFLGVALGAFGAHGLKHTLDGVEGAAGRLQCWETAARYQLVHALALGLVALVAAKGEALPLAAGASFAAGVALFSGSLYAMALTDARWLARATPVGGVLLLLGWVLVGLAAWRSPS
jgi:uncharacterized membrane protein YgdD (TMEM256/DUF423 family)